MMAARLLPVASASSAATSFGSLRRGRSRSARSVVPALFVLVLADAAVDFVNFVALVAPVALVVRPLAAGCPLAPFAPRWGAPERCCCCWRPPLLERLGGPSPRPRLSAGRGGVMGVRL